MNVELKTMKKMFNNVISNYEYVMAPEKLKKMGNPFFIYRFFYLVMMMCFSDVSISKHIRQIVLLLHLILNS